MDYYKFQNAKTPLVFDTLLGRLDQNHKKNIIEKFINQCNDQVIILATDTEIDDSYVNLLKPHLSNMITIEFDNDTNTTAITYNDLDEVSA